MTAQMSSRQSVSLRRSVRRAEASQRVAAEGDEVHRPRHQAAEQDRKIEPERPRVVEALGREALEVVADEEALKIRAAVLEPHRDIPRQADDSGDQRRDSNPAHIELQAAPFAPGDRQQDDGRHDERDRALHQKASAGAKPGERPPLRSRRSAGPVPAASAARSAAQMPSVMQKVSGRSGSAARAIAK